MEGGTPGKKPAIIVTDACYHGLKGFLVWLDGTIPSHMRPGSPTTLASEFTIPTPIQMESIYAYIYIRVYLL